MVDVSCNFYEDVIIIVTHDLYLEYGQSVQNLPTSFLSQVAKN